MSFAGACFDLLFFAGVFCSRNKMRKEGDSGGGGAQATDDKQQR